ncbi:exopolysaccharide Pel transporter PelG [Sphaerotilus uruguayifluvii]|uniref:Membrane protein n=1 Tax=Sphaerotilus uruguayifluvii TaxID=2735897 RepID=A0ABX2FZ61_9BURK|nr:exopolysaccharide Pel transporter PelG [Leptothrix sp. C29]NRT54477.1 putative membrane protein [Leptothrix sp. C29]
MAGIGFELRKLLQRDSYAGLLKAYAYAGVISSGPWVLSIVGILLVGMIAAGSAADREVTRFQVMVTWLILCSLVLTGPIQLSFTRWVADRLFERRRDLIVPNFLGALLLVLAGCGTLGLLAAALLFPGQGNLLRVLIGSGLAVLGGIWLTTIFLSGMKQYGAIVLLFLLGYGVTVLASLGLRRFGLEGLLGGFVLGQFVLLAGMLMMVLRTLPTERMIAFAFLRRGAMYGTLVWVGVLYNLGVWADKLVFWLSPEVSQPIIGPLRASIIYDLPAFLAYLAIIPGMAVFLVRIETDFVEYYERFFDAVREGGSLDQIRHLRDEMVFTIRQGLYEILKIQGITTVLVMVLAPRVLDWIGISHLYLPLLYLDVVAASLQVVLLGLLNIFFYLDRRRVVLGLTVLLLALNTGLSWLTLQLGAAYYGYGVALAMMITVFVAMLALESRLHRLEYETFMLQ